jgi:hypothetical protein
LFKSALVIPFLASKFSLKLGNEKLPLTTAPEKENDFSQFPELPLGPGDVANMRVCFS